MPRKFDRPTPLPGGGFMTERFDPTSGGLPDDRHASPLRPALAEKINDGIDSEGAGYFGDFKQHWRRPSIFTRLKAKPSDLYPDALSLFNACVEYFEWNDSNHVKNVNVSAYKGEVTKVKVSRMRAPSIRGLLNWLGVSMDTWTNWRETDLERREVANWAENVMHIIKYEAAAADVINVSLAMRDLGLADRKEITQEGTVRVVTEYELPQNGRDVKTIEGDYTEIDE